MPLARLQKSLSKQTLREMNDSITRTVQRNFWAARATAWMYVRQQDNMMSCIHFALNLSASIGELTD
jgi:hypothetical protein